MSERNETSITVPGDWTLLSADSFPFLYTDVGQASFGGDRTWRLGCAITGSVWYVFTDLPHPDNPARKRIYELSIAALVQRLATRLHAQEGRADA